MAAPDPNAAPTWRPTDVAPEPRAPEGHRLWPLLRAIEAAADADGWYQPHLLFAVCWLDDETELHSTTLAGHPVDALPRISLPVTPDALFLVTEGRARRWEHDRVGAVIATRARAVYGVDVDGHVVSALRIRDEELVCSLEAPVGAVPDAVRACLRRAHRRAA